MATKMADKMFGNSPKLEREEGGKLAVKHKAKEKDTSRAEGEDEAGSGQELPVTVRHAMARHDLHHAHEREQHMHDMGKHGDKKEMHGRHQAAIAALYKAHEKEHGKEKE